MHACDRQMDGQTDRILIARPRMHSMQRSNKCLSIRIQRILKVKIRIQWMRILTSFVTSLIQIQQSVNRFGSLCIATDIPYAFTILTASNDPAAFLQ